MIESNRGEVPALVTTRSVIMAAGRHRKQQQRIIDTRCNPRFITGSVDAENFQRLLPQRLKNGGRFCDHARDINT
jgi:hypothetical protein